MEYYTAIGIDVSDKLEFTHFLASTDQTLAKAADF